MGLITISPFLKIIGLLLLARITHEIYIWWSVVYGGLAPYRRVLNV